MKEFNVIKEMLPTLSLDYDVLRSFFKLAEVIINEYKEVIIGNDEFREIKVSGFAGFKKNNENEVIADFIISAYYIDIPLTYLCNEDIIKEKLKEKRRIIKEEERKRKEIEKKNKELDEKYGYVHWKTIDDVLTTTDGIEGFADTIEDAKRTLYEEMNKEN